MVSSDNAVIVTLGLNQAAGVSEELWYDLPVKLTLSAFQKFDVGFRLSDPQRTFLSPILLVHSGGHEIWLRIGDYRTLSVSLRNDGTYDVDFPVTATASIMDYGRDQMQHLSFDVADALQRIFPNFKNFTIDTLRLGFGKNNALDFTAPTTASLELSQVSFSGSDWFPVQSGTRTSDGFSISTIGKTALNASVFVPKAGYYALFIRGASVNGSSLRIELNDSQIETHLPANGHYDWVRPIELDLPEGWLNVRITPPTNDTIYLDQLVLLSQTNRADTSRTPVVSYERIDPAQYTVHVSSDRPSFLVFSEAYNPSWILRMSDGTIVHSTPAYSFGNLFIVDHSGDFSATLEWSAGPVFDFAKYLSISTFFFLLTITVVPARFARALSIRRKRARLVACSVR
jgi:hypothetical protein